MRRLTFAFLALLAAASLPAAIPPLLSQAMSATSSNQKDWAFTQTTVENGLKTVEKFDPSQPEGKQWQLLLSEGHAPTSKELGEYAKKRSKENEAKKDKSKKGLEGMIRDGSVQLVRESAGEAVYDFRLPADDEDDRKFVDLMKGRATVLKSGPYVALLELYNEKPIAPGMSVHIDKIDTKMSFQPVVAGGPVLLREMKATVRGRAMLVKSLDTDSVITFSEYRKVK